MSLPWEARREGEATAAYLGRALDTIGLPALAENARKAHYDDYFCPPDVDDGMNIHRLVFDVRRASTRLGPVEREQARALIAAAMDGEFDGTKEESEAWTQSADGQAAFRLLVDE